MDLTERFVAIHKLHEQTALCAATQQATSHHAICTLRAIKETVLQTVKLLRQLSLMA